MDPVSEIKARLSISEVVGKYVALKPAGRNMKGLCPFHSDHDPSFLVSNEKGLGWCFVCQNGGDVFSFIQKVENVDFPEALKILAAMANVELKTITPKESIAKEKKLRFMELLEATQTFFRENLQKKVPVQEKIAERQMAPEIIERFEVGYAPDDFQTLVPYLTTQGYTRKEMLEAGVVSARDGRGDEVYDRFRGRIMFPIRDLHGSLCGFGGRIFGDGEPKYLNSPETILYQKSYILYGLNRAKEAIKKNDSCLMVEGYFDVIACHNAGIENVVAVSGVALSEPQVKLLQRFSKNLVFSFDADAAGKEATKRAVETAIKSGSTVFAIRFPQGKDPDEALRLDSKGFFQALHQKIPVMEFLFEETFRGKDLKDVAAQRRILDELFPFISLFPGELERSHYISQLAAKLQISENVLEREFAEFQKKNLRPNSPLLSIEALPVPARITLFSYLVGMISAFPDLFDPVRQNFLADLAPDGPEKRIYNAFSAAYNAAGQLTPEAIVSHLPVEEVQRWELYTLFAEEKNDHLPEKNRLSEIRKLINNLNRIFIQHELQKITRNLKISAKGTDEERELKKKHMDFTRLLSQL